MSKTKFDERGRELPDPTPLAIPAGFVRPPTLQEQVARLVRHEGYLQALNSGAIESPEEADDFDVDDEDFPASRWEYEADEQDFRTMVREERRKYDREQAKKKAVKRDDSAPPPRQKKKAAPPKEEQLDLEESED